MLSVWTAIGFLGQALFSMRFLIQWIHSERIKRSIVPEAFWYFSVAGGVTLSLTRYTGKIPSSSWVRRWDL